MSVLVRDRTWVQIPCNDWGNSTLGDPIALYTFCKLATSLFATYWDLGINNFSTAWYDTFNEQPHITFRDE